MNTDIVHEHDVAPLQGRSEKLFRIGLEHLAGHRSFEHERRSDTIMTQRSDEGDGFPIAVRQLLDQSLPLRRPPVETGNCRGDARFIDKNKALRIKPWLLLPQGLACGEFPSAICTRLSVVSLVFCFSFALVLPKQCASDTAN